MRCLRSARYTMTAEVLRTGTSAPGDTVDLDEEGTWETQQDEISGEIISVWVPLVSDTPTGTTVVKIPCMVRSIVDGGIRVAGTTERFGKEYENIDFATIDFGPKFVLTKRDRITNVRDKRTGVLIWREEELDKVDADYRATVFNVNGVQPVIDHNGRLVEQHALLSRARAS